MAKGTLFSLAFRNLFRSKRRNALSGGTMVLGSAALVLGSGLSDGIARQLTRNLVSVQTGHLQLVVRPEDFQPQNSPFDAYGQDPFQGAESLARRIQEVGKAEGVLGATPFFYGRGTAVAGNRSSLASIVGIDPGREQALRSAQAPESGSFLPEGDPRACYVASPVARKLRLSVGDSVSLVVQTPRGAVNSLDAEVCGIFRKSAPWYDLTFYITLAAAQTLFDEPGGATNLKIALADGDKHGARRARGALVGLIASEALPRGARLETFDEAGRFSFSIIQANESALVILSFFLFLAAAVGIVNSLLMSVHERTREIGTVRALGMRRSLVVRLFILEGLALGLVSALLGVALGGAIVLYFGFTGIRMNTMTLAWMAGGDELYPVLRIGSLLRALGAITALSTLAAVYPALTASRLEPREALQHV